MSADRRAAAGRVALWAYSLLVVAFLLFPTLLLVPVSFGAAEHLQFPPHGWSVRWYRAYLQDPDWIGPTKFSLRVATLTAAAATALGTMAALAMVKGRLAGSTVLNALLVAPLIFPAIVYAIAVLFLFAPLRLTGTLAGFVLAHTVLAAPYVVLIVGAALVRLDSDLELAALSLGASRWTAALRVTLPLVLPGILSASAFAFHASFDDATVSFFISGVTDKSLPRKMFENVEFSVSPVLAVVSTLFTAVTLLVVGAAHVWASAASRPRAGTAADTAAPASDGTQWVALDAKAAHAREEAIAPGVG